MSKEYTFTELSVPAQKRAIYEYKQGWEETHDKNDLSESEVREILEDNLDYVYTRSGQLIDDEY